MLPSDLSEVQTTSLSLVESLRRVENGGTWVLPPGTHHIFPESLPCRSLHISNNDDGIKHILFDLSGREDLTIDGTGSELMIHGHVLPFFLRDTKRITLRNLTVDWANPFCAQGEVVAAGPDWVEIQLEDAYEFQVRDGILEALHPDVAYPVGLHNLNYIDPVRGEQAYESTDEFAMLMQHRYQVVERAHGRFRIQSGVMRNRPAAGQIAVFHFDHRISPVIAAQRSERIRVENTTIYHSGGIAMIFEGCRDVTIHRSSVKRRGNRWFSALNDATHFVECGGDLFLTECLFEFQNDDATNIHGIYRTVDAALDPQTLLLRLMHYQQFGVDTVQPGDRLALCMKQSLEIRDILEVAEVIPNDHQCTAYRFTEALPELDWNHIVVMKYDTDVNILIKGNTIRNNRARGVLATSLGKIRIRDNFFHTPGPAVQIEYGVKGKWFESCPVEDVEITGNVFQTSV